MEKETITSHLFQAETIAQALPFMQQYAGRPVVIKYGGNAMGDQSLADAFASDIVLLKQAGVHPIVVHGGGPQIGAMLDRLNIESNFENGLRVTDAQTVEIVEMVLSGSINKSIVASINAQGGKAVGISGKDGKLVTANKVRKTMRDPDSNIDRIIDLGYVGEPKIVDLSILNTIIQTDLIPVIAPVAADKEGQTYNINADTFAGKIAEALNATRLLLLTNVTGVLDEKGDLIAELTVSEARKMIKDGVATGGMIPKIETCCSAVDNGAEGVVILDGEVPHAVLLELLTPHGAGTLIKPDSTRHDETPPNSPIPLNPNGGNDIA